MRTFQSGVLLATLLLSAASATAFDIKYVVTNEKDVAKYMTIERPGEGRNFVDKVVSYIRFVPKQGSTHAYPVFINTHNYLTCPNSEKKWQLNDVKQVNFDKRSGITVLGFFFDTPPCDEPLFHMEPIVGDA